MSETMDKPEAKAAAKKAPKRYKITFHGDGGDVEIAHNFRLNLYKRNVETEIDEHFLAVLRDAVIHTVVEDSNGTRKAVTIPMHAYSLGEAV